MSTGAFANSAGRTALAHRIGTHGKFKAAMQAALAGQPALKGLTVRRDDDPSMALLDAWAGVLDVLAFYQERIANEGFLHTATERRSLLELGRAIGYQLKTGVAASAYLAFQLEDAAGSPSVVTIEPGAQAQSIPKQDELPQIFETVEPVEARIAWNALKPRMSRAQQLKIGTDALLRVDVDGVARATTELVFAGAGTAIRAGELLVVALRNDSGMLQVLPLRVLSVSIDHAASLTHVEIDPGNLAEEQPKVAPLLKQPTASSGRNPFTSKYGQAGKLVLNDAAVKDLVLGHNYSNSELIALAWRYGWNLAELMQIIERLTRGKSLLAADEGVFALRVKCGFFGNSAPWHGSLLKDGLNTLYKNNWDRAGGWDIWTDSLSDPEDFYQHADVYLERSIPELVKGGWAVFELPSASGISYTVFRIGQASDASIAGFGMSGKAAALQLTRLDGSDVIDSDKHAWSHLTFRETSAHVNSQRLTLAELPIDAALNAGDTQIELDGMLADFTVGKWVALSGERADASGVMSAEILSIAAITHAGGFTTLQFASGLQYSYLRNTVTLNANVARATHGETRTEVLGSGDGSKAFQAFRLKQQPLTYIPAATASGVESTLEVRVNRLLWEEVDSLHGLASMERVYVTERANDGTVTVRFGDGVTGARLPTGTENVTATYRVGSGLDGLVEAGQIGLLMTRPLGLKGVVNPIAAAGAADPETLDEARLNAPLTVLSMGRIVSLQDFADFARSFAGVAKAQATQIWRDARQLVHLTIAGAEGAAIEPTSELQRNLGAAIAAAGHIEQAPQIDSYQPLLFSVAARVRIDDAYPAGEVLAALQVALLEAFSFHRRNFAQPVLLSEVLGGMQDVAGVTAVDLDALYLSTEPPALNDTLPARGARLEESVIVPAELLTIHPAGIVLTEMA